MEQESISLMRRKWALLSNAPERARKDGLFSPPPNSNVVEISVCYCSMFFLFILPNSLTFLFGDLGVGGPVTPPAVPGTSDVS